MSESVSYTRLGAFVLAGVALLIAAVVVFGGGLLRPAGVLLETYFDESVQGLELGAPVNYRGVQIGTVSEIAFAYDVYGIPVTDPRFYREGRYVVVRFHVRAQGEIEEARKRLEQRAANELAAGLRVSLSSNPITGTAMLQLDYVDPARYPELSYDWQPKALYVPSVPSAIAQIGTAATRVMDRINALDIEGVVTSLRGALDGIDKAVGDAEIGRLSDEAQRTLADLRETSRSLRGRVEHADVAALQKSIAATLAQVEGLSRDTNVAIGERNAQLAELIGRLGAAVSNLEEATRTLRASPATLLRATPPPPFDPAAAR